MLWLLLACSDYTLEGGPNLVDPGRDTGTQLPGDLGVDPERVHLGALCEQQTSELTLTLSSEGPGPITVLSWETQAWTVQGPELPFTLAYGESAELTVSGGVGSDTLRITTDQSELEVPLAATADLPPTLTLNSPGDDLILEIGETLVLDAQLYDAETKLLSLAWSSDVDGAIGVATVDSSGRALLEWPASARSSGPHTLSAQVLDACNQSAALQLGVCQQAGYDAESLDLSGWHFEGSASYDSSQGWVELTPIGTDLVGSAFQTGATTRGNNVTLDFQFYVSDGSGADGFAVTALDIDRMTTFLGGTGGCLGYGDCEGGGLPGWTIEVDTYDNGGQDPTELDHIAFSFDGDYANPKAWSALPEMEDGAWHTMSITVSDPHVSASIDGVLYIDQDIAGSYDFPAYVGFSATTGSLTNRHLIDALTVTEFVCQGDD